MAVFYFLIVLQMLNDGINILEGTFVITRLRLVYSENGTVKMIQLFFILKHLFVGCVNSFMHTK
jgi:hypothetical protein